LRRAPHGAGEIRLRSVEGQPHLQLAEQRASRQLPLQPAQPPPVDTEHVAGRAVPHRAVYLPQMQAVQLRLDPRHHPARRQKPRQHQHGRHEHGQDEQNFPQSNQAPIPNVPRAA
jgi:hypothetical protein